MCGIFCVFSESNSNVTDKLSKIVSGKWIKSIIKLYYWNLSSKTVGIPNLNMKNTFSITLF